MLERLFNRLHGEATGRDDQHARKQLIIPTCALAHLARQPDVVNIDTIRQCCQLLELRQSQYLSLLNAPRKPRTQLPQPCQLTCFLQTILVCRQRFIQVRVHGAARPAPAVGPAALHPYGT